MSDKVVEAVAKREKETRKALGVPEKKSAPKKGSEK